MEKFFWGLLLGLVIGAGGAWWYHSGGKQKIPDVRGGEVQGEFSRYGVVIKEKARAAGAAIADATADHRTTLAIKSKLAAELGAATVANISVSTTDGVVTLAGTVSSEEELAKAVNVAYGAEGVHKVYSTMQVKPAENSQE